MLPRRAQDLIQLASLKYITQPAHDCILCTQVYKEQKEAKLSKKEVLKVVPGFFSTLGTSLEVTAEEMSYRTGVIRILMKSKSEVITTT